MPGESFFTQRDAAVEYTALARRCAALFTAAGEAVGHVDDAASKIALATFSRRVGLHAAAWNDLVPESVLLADLRAAVPASPEIARDRIAIIDAMSSLRVDLDALMTRGSLVADGSALRLAAAVLADVVAALAVLAEPTGG